MATPNSTSFLLPLAVAALAAAAPAQFAFATPITTPNPLGGGGYSAFVRMADLNGDAYPDLLLSGYSGTALAFNNMPGSLGFTVTTLVGIGGGQVYAADLNADGYDDLLLASYSPVAIQYAINDGTGAFPGPIGSFAISGTSIRSLLIANLDGDADLEIAVHKRVGPSSDIDILDLTQGASLPTFSLAATIASGGGSGHQTITGLDVDDDDDLDLIVNGGQIHYNQLDQAPTSTSPSFANVSYLDQWVWGNTLGRGDFNGDGLDDVFTVRSYNGSSTGGVQAWISGAACGITSTKQSVTVNEEWGWWGEAGDFDNDGKDEILFTSSTWGSAFNLHAVVPSPNGVLDPLDLTSPTIQLANVQVAAIADFDLDGYVDIAAWQGSDLSLLMNTSAALVNQGKFSEVVTESLWTPATVAPNYIWVDASSTSSSPTGAVDQPFATIPDAVAVATPGSAIMVQAGQYGSETSGELITLNNLQLIGVSGPKVTTLDRYTFDCSNGARLSGFTLRSCPGLGNIGLVNVSDGTVTGNVLFGVPLMKGIRVIPGAHTANIGCNIVHEFDTGILVEHGSAAGGYPSARIYNNTVVDNTVGIEFGAANAIEIVNNLIVANGTKGIHRNCNGTVLTSLLVDYNWVHTNGIVDNYVTTVPIGVGTCNSPITLQAGLHDINTPWDMAWFVDANGDDFHLTGDQATDLGNPTFLWTQWFPTDIDGDPRSVRDVSQPTAYQLAPDLGADEFTGLKLTFRSDASHWYFTTTGICAGCGEIKGFANSPGWLPGISDSILLLSPFNIITLGLGFGPTSVTTIVKTPATIGTRLYAQSLVGNPTNGALTLTNAVVLTTN